MLGLGKYAQSWFYIEYLIYTHISVLWINRCQLFINFVCIATHKKSYGLLLTGINELRKRLVYITYGIIIFFYIWLYYVVYNV